MESDQKALLMLHRKESGMRKCICGSEMDLKGTYWVCRRKLKTNEPNSIIVGMNIIMRAKEMMGIA